MVVFAGLIGGVVYVLVRRASARREQKRANEHAGWLLGLRPADAPRFVKLPHGSRHRRFVGRGGL
jgi:hypothetical protein